MDHADEGDNNDIVFIYMGGSVPQHLRDIITHIRIHESVKIITARAFQKCISLESVEMHAGVEIIEEGAFYRCTSLRGIILPGVKVIEDNAFNNCTALENVEFGAKLETIGSAAFAFTFLRTIKIPKVRVIGLCAFYECLHLTDVKFSKDLETIGNWAFKDCHCLRRIFIPLKENLLDEDTFDNCGDLSKVDLVGGIHKTVSSLLLDSWRNEMNDEIDRINRDLPSTPVDDKTTTIRRWMERVLERIDYYKSEHYTLLKEFTTLLELALWKANLDENVVEDAAAREEVRVTRGHRKRARKGRCITSGASVVIKNVLPFLKLE